MKSKLLESPIMFWSHDLTMYHSTAMIEAHYSAYIVTALDELAALAAVSLIVPAPTQLRSVG